MNPIKLLAICGVLAGAAQAVRADVVTDWNATIRDVMQTDGILNSPALSNPGWSTRTIAMMNGGIYDAFQSVNRTHTPLMYSALTPGASREAAAAQAAYEIILDCYPLRHDILDSALTGPTGTLTLIPDSPAKTAGIALGHAIAQQYLAAHKRRRIDGHQLHPVDGAREMASRPMESRSDGLGSFVRRRPDVYGSRFKFADECARPAGRNAAPTCSQQSRVRGRLCAS